MLCVLPWNDSFFLYLLHFSVSNAYPKIFPTSPTIVLYNVFTCFFYGVLFLVISRKRTINFSFTFHDALMDITGPHVGFKYSIVIPLSDIRFFFLIIFIWYQSRNFPSIFIVLSHFMIITSRFFPFLFRRYSPIVSYPRQMFPLLFDNFFNVFFLSSPISHFFFIIFLQFCLIVQ